MSHLGSPRHLQTTIAPGWHSTSWDAESKGFLRTCAHTEGKVASQGPNQRGTVWAGTFGRAVEKEWGRDLIRFSVLSWVLLVWMLLFPSVENIVWERLWSTQWLFAGCWSSISGGLMPMSELALMSCRGGWLTPESHGGYRHPRSVKANIHVEVSLPTNRNICATSAFLHLPVQTLQYLRSKISG